MSDIFLETVSISIVGIGLLFLALLFLTGLMFLLTALTRERTAAGPTVPAVSPTHEAGALRARAAVIGVALARSEHKSSSPPPPETETPVGGWRALHHQRQLNQYPPRRTR